MLLVQFSKFPMKLFLPRSVPLRSLTCAALLAAQWASASSNPHEVYAEVGPFGARGIGYAYSFSDIFGMRADFSRLGTGRNFNDGEYRYEAALKGRQFGAYADWFPFGGTFHLSAGLTSRKLDADANARFNNVQDIRVGGVPVAGIDANDWVKASLKWSSVAPYLGLGFGHSTAQRAGFGFVSEIGVTLGAPKVQLSVSESLREKVDLVTSNPGLENPWAGISTDEAIENQRRELADDASKIKVFPHLSIGVEFRF